jgi:hypothetical protein
VLTADGRFVIRTDDNQLRERKLTPVGVQRVRDELVATGLFERDQGFPLKLRPGATPPGRGVSGLNFTAWRETRTVDVQTAPDQGPDEIYFEPSAARTRLDRLSKQLRNPESWLSADAWADPTSRPYDVGYLALLLRSEPGPTNVTEMVGALIRTWPFSVGPLALGQTLPDGAGPGADRTRCTVLTKDDLQAVRDAVVRAGGGDSTYFLPDGSWVVGFALADRSGDLVVHVQPLFPDRTSCNGVSI